MTDPTTNHDDTVRTAIPGERGRPRHTQRAAPSTTATSADTAGGIDIPTPWKIVGGKNADGVYQTIINQMPPHHDYIELFTGSGSIIRRKRPAPRLNLAIEADAPTAARLQLAPPRQALQCNAFTFLDQRADMLATANVLFYADPPYPLQTRQGRRYYAHELCDDDHARLLAILTNARAMVLISGYRCPLYDNALKTWRRIDYPTMTRGGTPRVESLWMNFPQPLELHDYQFLGENFRERERIRKLIRRWRRRLEAMPPLQRAALLHALNASRR